MRLRTYVPMSWQTRLKLRRVNAIGKGGIRPRRVGGRIQPNLRQCRICYPFECRHTEVALAPTRRTPVGKRRDKRGQRKPR